MVIPIYVNHPNIVQVFIIPIEPYNNSISLISYLNLPRLVKAKFFIFIGTHAILIVVLVDLITDHYFLGQLPN